MKTHTQKETTGEAVSGLTVTRKHQCIKLGIDWHARTYVVVRIIDGAGPEPAQRFAPEKFLQWARKQTELAEETLSCYEAGAGGYVLHRQLEAIGVKNTMTAPRKLSGGVKNDSRDARELAMELDRWARGNPKALRVVHVPTPEQERRRQESRQREQLRRARLSFAAQGRSLLLGQGWIESNSWWKKARWEKLSAELPEWMIKALEIFRRLILEIEGELQALTRSIEEAASSERPKGMGALTSEQLEREVCDWKRFPNRKSTGAYTGLVGGLHATGGYACELPITKAGSARLRAILIELAWRWVRYQPRSPLVRRWGHALFDRRASKRARKRAIVAIARQLFVDIWRWKTGRASAEQLGWTMLTAPAATAQAAEPAAA